MMSFLSLHVSFWGYDLNTLTYLLNLVSFKLVSLTPIEKL